MVESIQARPPRSSFLVRKLYFERIQLYMENTWPVIISCQVIFFPPVTTAQSLFLYETPIQNILSAIILYLEKIEF